jgi:nicotinamidase-related amidase
MPSPVLTLPKYTAQLSPVTTTPATSTPLSERQASFVDDTQKLVDQKIITPAEKQAYLLKVAELAKNTEKYSVVLGEAYMLILTSYKSRYEKLAELLKGNPAASLYLIEQYQLLKTAETVPTALIEKITPDEKLKVEALWAEKDVRGTMLQEINDDFKAAVKKYFSEAFEKTYTIKPINYDAFIFAAKNGQTGRAGFESEFSAEERTLIEKKLVYFKAMAERQDLKEYLYTAFLFNNVFLKYEFNIDFSDSFHTLLKLEGDCTEVTYFYHDILTLKDQAMSFYIIASKNKPTNHTFGAIKVDDEYYLLDTAGLWHTKNFADSVKASNTQKPYDFIWQYNGKRLYFDKKIAPYQEILPASRTEEIAPR